LHRLRAELVDNRVRYQEALKAQNDVIASARQILEWTGPKPSKA